MLLSMTIISLSYQGIASSTIDVDNLLIKFKTSPKGIRFLTSDGKKFIFNHTRIKSAAIEVYYIPINSTHIKALVNITGIYIYDTMHHEEMDSVLSGRKTITIERGSLEEKGRYSFTLTFIIHISSNYAWLNGEFIGFFPFYIFPTIGYKNATRIIRHLYMGNRLELHTIGEGEAFIKKTHLELGNGSEIVIPTLWIYNDYCSIEFVYHYPICVKCLLPLDNNTYVYFDLRIDDDYIPIILKINDYPVKDVYTYVDYPRLIMVLVILGGIVVGIMLLMRYIRGGRI